MSQPNYLFYPSLLDAYQYYLEADENWEQFYDGSDNPEAPSHAEYLAQCEKELLDKINRVPHEPIEAAACGTCFNEIVDCLVEHRPCGHEGMTIKSNKKDNTIVATLDGFTFTFDMGFCLEAGRYFAESIPQYRCEAEIDTKYGTVGLYGYIDELRANMVFDIKTTRNYLFGKFERHWQKVVYPYCLIESGDCTEIEGFEYTVYKLSGGNGRNLVISAEMFSEYYAYKHDEAKVRLRLFCESFIEWLNQHRDQITDKKVFGIVE